MIIFISWSLFQNRDFSIMNMLLLPSSSRATMTLTTSRILLTLIHSDFPYSVSTNLVQLLQIWISSFSFSSFPQGPFGTKAFSIMNMLLSSSSRATTTLTTCRIFLHYDNNDSSFWFSIFCSNLVQLPKLWISSSPFGMSLLLTRVPWRQRQRGRTPDKLWEQYILPHSIGFSGIIFIDLSSSLLLVTCLSRHPSLSWIVTRPFLWFVHRPFKQ